MLAPLSRPDASGSSQVGRRARQCSLPTAACHRAPRPSLSTGENGPELSCGGAGRLRVNLFSHKTFLSQDMQRESREIIKHQGVSNMKARPDFVLV